jgi:type I restriction enzyme M protein
VNGIFEGRFDVVLTNPPFGSNVGDDQRVNSSAQTRVFDSPEYRKLSQMRYGATWAQAHDRLRKAAKDKKPILNLFEIGRDRANRPTEQLFLERCIQLLRPGGRMGIVLPDGNLNNPSLNWLRRWAEGKARLTAIVSLPEVTFDSSDATVKASLVFMRKFTETEGARWDKLWKDSHDAIDDNYTKQRESLHALAEAQLSDYGVPALHDILAELAAINVRRYLPTFSFRPLPAYMHGAPSTVLRLPKWKGTPSNKGEGKRLKEGFVEELERNAGAVEDQIRKVRIELRKIDSQHNAELWDYVRAR